MTRRTAPLDRTPATALQPRGRRERIGRLAVRALYHEAVLYPKPGLVSAQDNGAHRDMSLATFYRAIVALRPLLSRPSRRWARRARPGAR